MARRRLWELSCPAKDVVLWSGLDWREALSIADLAMESPHAATGAPHQLCHGPTPVAVRLDALLETHKDAAREAEAAPIDEVAEGIRRDVLPLPAAGPQGRLQVDGPRALAFGKVELIEVAR